jgi:predicted acyltransferase
MKNFNTEGLPPERLESLDILRGFDMLWIIGAGTLIITLNKDSGIEWLKPLADQMRHVKWEGFHFFDLIFPLFMFISGVAIPYSVLSKVEKGVSRSSLLFKIIRRGLILVVLGITYNGTFKGEFVDVRFASVLAQIGLAYMFAAIIFLYNRTWKTRLIWLLGIVAMITILQLFVPVPNYGAGILDPVGGINAWIDRLLLPGMLIYETYDPEGLLCIISAITVTLAGGFAGSILRDGKPADMRKSLIISGIGGGLVLAALLLSPVYPIIKNAWTVPFNMLTAGISFLLLGLFYYVIDVMKWASGMAAPVAFFFKVIGMNSITIYMATKLISFNHTSTYLLGWLGAYWGKWVIILGVIILEWLLLYYLYKKKIFLRV